MREGREEGLMKRMASFLGICQPASTPLGLIRVVVVCLPFSLLAFAPISLCSAQVVDKMVATVNARARTDLITYSDLVWQLALQPRTSLDNPASEDLNHALRLLIDQDLILQDAEKLPTIVPTQRE